MPPNSGLPVVFGRRVPRLALALAVGAMAGLGQVPFSLVWLALPGFGLAFFLHRAAPGKTAIFWTGLIFGLGYFALTLFWIVEPFQVDVARHGWMAPFALVGLASGLAIFWGGAGVLARLLCGGQAGALAAGIAWVASMGLAELLRARVLTGFPWAMPGYVFSESPLAQLGAVVGPHGLNFLTLALAAALTGIVGQGVMPRVAALIAVLAPISLAAVISMATPPPVVPADGPMLRLVQPNAPQDQKWQSAMIPVFYNRALDLTRTKAGVAPDIVIWPETSVPVMLERAGEVIETISEASGRAELVLGALSRDDGGLRNAAVFVGRDATVRDIYQKWHLVPFGEYVPFLPQIAAFGWGDLAAEIGGGYAPGPGPRLIDLSGIGPVLPLICYEAIFPHELRTGPVRPAMLLQITNDAWFGTFSGPFQHLAQARMRAIEQGLPMVRVANTGVSAVIDARGRIVAQLPLGQAGYLDSRLPSALPATPYSKTGDIPLLLLLVLCGGATLVKARRKKD